MKARGRGAGLRTGVTLAVAVTTLAFGPVDQEDGRPWIDRPLTGWNRRGADIPAPPRIGDDARDEMVRRCDLQLVNPSAVEDQLALAGWIPFRYLDQQLRAFDVEVVGGLTGSDAMCRPMGFNVFVFVGGRFAGTLSPAPMTSRTDGVSGAVRILSADLIAAEFARYRTTDALCCPSSRMTVTFDIDRSDPTPVVVPTSVRTNRASRP